MTEKIDPRMPDLNFDDETKAEVAAMLAQPHHPSAAQDNVARAKHELQLRRASETEAVAR